jgi:hypothetical protein
MKKRFLIYCQTNRSWLVNFRGIRNIWWTSIEDNARLESASLQKKRLKRLRRAFPTHRFVLIDPFDIEAMARRDEPQAMPANSEEISVDLARADEWFAKAAKPAHLGARITSLADLANAARTGRAIVCDSTCPLPGVAGHQGYLPAKWVFNFSAVRIHFWLEAGMFVYVPKARRKSGATGEINPKHL